MIHWGCYDSIVYRNSDNCENPVETFKWPPLYKLLCCFCDTLKQHCDIVYELFILFSWHSSKTVFSSFTSGFKLFCQSNDVKFWNENDVKFWDENKVKTTLKSKIKMASKSAVKKTLVFEMKTSKSAGWKRS